MSLRAGGGPLVLRRDLGTPGPIQGQHAFGAALYGARLATALSAPVLLRAQDGALRFQIPVVGGGVTLVANAGVFALAGQDAALRVDRRVVADAGAFAFDGQDAALRFDRRVLAEAGVFTLAGQNAAFIIAPPASGITLVADAGVFTLAGQDAVLRVDRRVAGDAGAFVLAGQDAALRLDRRLVAEAGVFALLGQDAALRRDIRQVLEAGAFSLAGQEALLRAARRLVAEAGVFTLAGQAVEFVVPLSGGLVVARLARRPAQIARAWNRPAVVLRLIIRGDDTL